MSTKNAKPKPKPTTSSVDEKTGATRGFEPITIQSIDLETGATRGPAGMLGDDFTSGGITDIPALLPHFGGGQTGRVGRMQRKLGPG